MAKADINGMQQDDPSLKSASDYEHRRLPIFQVNFCFHAVSLDPITPSLENEQVTGLWYYSRFDIPIMTDGAKCFPKHVLENASCAKETSLKNGLRGLVIWENAADQIFHCNLAIGGGLFKSPSPENAFSIYFIVELFIFSPITLFCITPIGVTKHTCSLTTLWARLLQGNWIWGQVSRVLSSLLSPNSSVSLVHHS